MHKAVCHVLTEKPPRNEWKTFPFVSPQKSQSASLRTCCDKRLLVVLRRSKSGPFLSSSIHAELPPNDASLDQRLSSFLGHTISGMALKSSLCSQAVPECC